MQNAEIQVSPVTASQDITVRLVRWMEKVTLVLSAEMAALAPLDIIALLEQSIRLNSLVHPEPINQNIKPQTSLLVYPAYQGITVLGLALPMSQHRVKVVTIAQVAAWMKNAPTSAFIIVASVAVALALSGTIALKSQWQFQLLL